MEIIKNYINGELIEPSSGEYLNNFEPAKGVVYGKIPRSNKVDVELAVKAAKEAFPAWSNTPSVERAGFLQKISEKITEKLDSFARAESKDNGKPLKLAKKVDIPRSALNFKFYSSAIVHFESEAHPMEGNVINYTLRKPIGVVACISPWNLPLYLFTWKIAPALAAGNCVVAKPSEITPFTAYLLSKVCQEIGLPKGVLNIIHGLGGEVGSALTSHPDVPVISFTGGTSTGKEIARVAAPMFKKLSLELGGKNPNIIFADCNYEKALKTTIRSSFANQGQICLCGSRIFVEKSIYDKFLNDFVTQVKNLVVGDPEDEKTDQGALVSEEHMKKVLSYIDIAKEEGGKIECGGRQIIHSKPELNGWFIAPTVISGLDYNCRTNQEEIFGPVVTIMPFEKDEEALMMANSTNYGLSSSIWTTDINRAHYFADNLHAGIVWVNTWLLRDLRTPFGGVKQSGVGREGGFEVLKFFTESKNVCIQY